MFCVIGLDTDDAVADDSRRVHRIAERLHAGGVYINGGFAMRPYAPFGGIGISGFGKEGGKAGIDEFLHYKTVSIGTGTGGGRYFKFE